MPQSLDQLDAFMTAISSQESGGKVDVVNKDSGAYGVFQIMPANWPKWALEAGLGQFAPKTKENQYIVARFKMSQYFRKFGTWEAVAVAWYAGEGTAAKYAKNPTDPSWKKTQSTNGVSYPSIQNYVTQAIGRMTSAPTGNNTVGRLPTQTDGSTVPGGLPTATPGVGEDPTTGRLKANATADEVLGFIANHYGADLAGFLEIPEIKDLLIKAGQEGWTEDLFRTHMRSTEWWRTNSDSTRAFITAKITDPATYEAKIQEKLAQIKQSIEPLGLNLGGEAGQRKWAEDAIKFGWTSEQITAKLSTQLQHASDTRGFTADSIPDVTADKLMEIARMEFLTPIDRQTAERWAIKGLRQGDGGDVEAQFRSFMGTIASARFGVDPNSGIAPADIMAPVRQTIAQELELNAEAIDLLDPKYADVMQVEGKDGFRPMTQAEAGRWARSQDAYKHTVGGVDKSAALVEALSKTFGKVR